MSAQERWAGPGQPSHTQRGKRRRRASRSRSSSKHRSWRHCIENAAQQQLIVDFAAALLQVTQQQQASQAQQHAQVQVGLQQYAGVLQAQLHQQGQAEQAKLQHASQAQLQAAQVQLQGTTDVFHAQLHGTAQAAHSQLQNQAGLVTALVEQQAEAIQVQLHGTAQAHHAQLVVTALAAQAQLHSSAVLETAQMQEKAVTAQVQLHDAVQAHHAALEGTTQAAHAQLQSHTDAVHTAVEQQAKAAQSQLEGTAEAGQAQLQTCAALAGAQVQETANAAQDKLQGTAASVTTQIQEQANAVQDQLQGTAASVATHIQEQANAVQDQLQGTAASVTTHIQEQAKAVQDQLRGAEDAAHTRLMETADAIQAQLEATAQAALTRIQQAEETATSSIKKRSREAASTAPPARKRARRDTGRSDTWIEDNLGSDRLKAAVAMRLANWENESQSWDTSSKVVKQLIVRIEKLGIDMQQAELERATARVDLHKLCVLLDLAAGTGSVSKATWKLNSDKEHAIVSHIFQVDINGPPKSCKKFELASGMQEGWHRLNLRKPKSFKHLEKALKKLTDEGHRIIAVFGAECKEGAQNNRTPIDGMRNLPDAIDIMVSGLELLTRIKADWILENPASSMLWVPMLQVLKHFIFLNTCQFGADHPKDTLLAFSSASLRDNMHRLAKVCPGTDCCQAGLPSRHLSKMTVKSGSINRAAYPEQLAAAMVGQMAEYARKACPQPGTWVRRVFLCNGAEPKLCYGLVFATVVGNNLLFPGRRGREDLMARVIWDDGDYVDDNTFNTNDKNRMVVVDVEDVPVESRRTIHKYVQCPKGSWHADVHAALEHFRATVAEHS